MVNIQTDSEDEVEVALRMLGRGFLDLHLAVRTGDIVDPYALPETMGDGMQRLSKLCVKASVNDLGDSIHCLSDAARRLPVGEWGVPQFAAPFRFSEVKLLSTEPAAPTEECRALAAKGQSDDAFEDIHHRQLREIVQRVRTEARLLASARAHRPQARLRASRVVRFSRRSWRGRRRRSHAAMVDGNSAGRIATRRFFQDLRELRRATVSPP
jgi:hypothetical protein